MRRKEYHGTSTDALKVLEELEVMQVAGIDGDGRPVLKTVNFVVEGNWVCFHGAPAGEKVSLVDRPVVLSFEETVTRLPSFFMDAERACPATTLYRGVQVHGLLQAVAEPARKARVLQGLMEKLQPDGHYVPIAHDSPMYRAAVNGLLIVGVPLEDVTTKLKLMQNKTAAERASVLERLWQRGAPSDARAIELIRAANAPGPVPEFLVSPHGTSLHVWLPPEAAAEAVALIADEYWNDGFSRDTLAASHQGSTAWVGVRDGDGALVGTARAIADGAKCAWVYDVCVRSDWRRRGLGQVLMKAVLDHPRVRRCEVIRLGTRDAQRLYARFGFIEVHAMPPRAFSTTEMILRRGGRA
jgi:nitroimidazol reductase NimA-like FMN-containing flavoprotein (pyridoxamine 5'-phosphate oxidase superfamily)/GNAT superfamily N-acetyltransferase